MQLLHLGLGQPLGRYPVDSAIEICLTSLTWAFWIHGRTNVAVISEFGEVVPHSGLWEFHSYPLCCEVSRQGRNERGTMSGAPNHRGERWKVPRMSQVFLQYSTLTPKRPQVRTWGANLVPCPGRHLTSIRPCQVDSSQKSHLWRLHLRFLNCTVTWRPVTGGRQHHTLATLHKPFHEEPGRMLSRVQQSMCRLL